MSQKIRELTVVVLMFPLWASSAHGGTSWEERANSNCVGDKDPYVCCSGSGTGSCDGQWRLVINYTDVRWMQLCQTLALEDHRGTDIPVCTDAASCVGVGDPYACCTGAGTGPTCRANDDDATDTATSCPTAMDGERFPYRKSLDDGTLPSMLRSGDGTFSGASGVSPDVDFDKWPNPGHPTDNKYNNREDLDDSRAKWRNAGTWMVPWDGGCRTKIRAEWAQLLFNARVSRGETMLDKQAVPVAEAVD